ncbi:hypothetical protein [Thioclava pacifica]|uniref:Uncharacterized protein n=1 Tax=Thioclava pacifica DSM 10166 TaxID=1353537 RepID=A0A074JI66_9RHOB|nr:hypothetical protein [Thioclava pacifica]KEO56144.1 hypothetical protein TP2_01095 [Thioclava pacifica DSM 10166]
MSLEYFIRDELTGAALEISETKYLKLKNAATAIDLIQEVEDNFDLFASAFIELEEYQMSATIRYYYSTDRSEDLDRLFEDIRPKLNLKLVGFLTASRSYDEQIHQRADALIKISSDLEIDLRKEFSKVYNESFEYRVMYYLRNHAQHHRPPLGRLSFSHSNQWESYPKSQSPVRSRISINPKLNIDDLLNSKKIKQTVRGEIERLKAKHLDLKFFTRGFVQEIYKIHQTFRNSTEDELLKLLDTIKGANEDLAAFAGKACDYPVLEKKGGNGNNEKTLLDYSHQARVLDKRKLWAGLAWVQRGYISSEISFAADTFPKSDEEVWIVK